jgi:hypothetical protein
MDRGGNIALLEYEDLDGDLWGACIEVVCMRELTSMMLGSQHLNDEWFEETSWLQYDKYYFCTQNDEYTLIKPVKKTKLALKVTPKENIIKEDEEWMWVK